MSVLDMLKESNLKITIKAPFSNFEWKSSSKTDKDAAWDLYVELLTRITTQPLLNNTGVEQTALESIHLLFKITRDTLKQYGRSCINFSKIAIPVLNQTVRPFTAKWHLLSSQGAFKDESKRKEFRSELEKLQEELRRYTKLLSILAEVEDLTKLDKV